MYVLPTRVKSKLLQVRDHVLFTFLLLVPNTVVGASNTFIKCLLLNECIWNQDINFFKPFISIYFMLNLLLAHKFLFLQFLLGYLFLLCNLFCFRYNLLFFGKDHLRVAGRAHASAHELCKFYTTSWELCSPRCTQFPENLYLHPKVQHYSLHF